mmetsp:Transcript_13716/g.49898  ORF Transcript_13716/g.49898 Transcript_13716/m.49898 type:complete len:439 (+) Transcript_13716:104-1420(+)
MSRPPAKRVPVNIVTGALGVGKTTCLRSLISSKPAGEQWVIIVNEFGALGIDAAVLDCAQAESELTVKQVAGGCLCCAAVSPLQLVVAQLLRQSMRRGKPICRILIEPSGLGHPGGLVDLLRGEHLRAYVEVRSIICLVDPPQLIDWWEHRQGDEGVTDSGAYAIYRQQVQLADLLVANKIDTLPSSDSSGQPEPSKVLLRYRELVAGMYPPKATLETSGGVVDMRWLDTASDGYMGMPGSTGGVSAHTPRTVAPTVSRVEADSIREQSEDEAYQTVPPTLGHPRCVEGKIVGHEQDGQAMDARSIASAGWLFALEELFNEASLLQLLVILDTQALRSKGVFRVADSKYVHLVKSPATSSMEGSARLEEIGYRRNSRFEVIVDSGSAKRLIDAVQEAFPMPDKVSCNENPSTLSLFKNCWRVVEEALKAVTAPPSTTR